MHLEKRFLAALHGDGAMLESAGIADFGLYFTEHRVGFALEGVFLARRQVFASSEALEGILREYVQSSAALALEAAKRRKSVIAESARNSATMTSSQSMALVRPLSLHASSLLFPQRDARPYNPRRPRAR